MGPEYKKITQAVNRLARKEGGNINYMKALKLLYLSDRLHLRKYGRLITEDSLIAMKNGTLGSEAKNIVTRSQYLPHIVYQYTQDKIAKISEYEISPLDANEDQLSESDVECLDQVYKMLGGKTQFQLADLTHDLPEWQRHKYVIENKEKNVVDLEISDLFKDSSNAIFKVLFNQSDEEISIAQEMFLESRAQRDDLALV